MKAYGLALTLGLAVGMFAPQALARDDDHVSSSAVPKLDHVFVIVLENHNSFTSFGSIGILDNPQAPQTTGCGASRIRASNPTTRC
jgi:hypothetical protein